MKASQIIAQLANVLPQKTTLFSDTVGVSTMSRSGTIVTVTTSSAHGLSTGDFINIVGASAPVSITSLTQTDNIAAAETATDHDLTFDRDDLTVTISGADQADYNGTHTLLGVSNRLNFTFQISGDPISPATGTILLENGSFFNGYNGLHEVTVVDPTTFTYVTSMTPPLDATGASILMSKNLRVSGAVDLDSIIDAYTRHDTDKLWSFVVLNDSVASKSRHIDNDATDLIAPGDVFRQRVVQTFTIYVVAPSTTSIAARRERDLMEDVAVAFYGSLLGIKYPGGLCETPFSTLTFVNHGFVQYVKSYYIHQFTFEITEDITEGDTARNFFHVAFRDIDFSFLNLTTDDVIMSACVDLDDSPLP